MRFQIGGEAAEYVAVEVAGRTIPSATDFWDGNWLTTAVEVRTGGFRGDFRANFRVEELSRFAEAIRALLERRSSTAHFETLEGQLDLTFTQDHAGRISVAGVAMDRPGIGQVLRFELQVDQSYLPRLLHDLASVLDAYPVRGAPA